MRFKKENSPNKLTRSILIAGLLGTATFSATLLLNKLLTGHFIFTSIINKGYFNHLPFSFAINRTITDAVTIFRRYFLADPLGVSHFYTLPIIATLFGFTGILFRSRKNKQHVILECILAAFALLSIGAVASGEYQGLSNDRYLAWLTPIWLIYIAIGLNKLLGKHKVALNLMMTILIAFQVIFTAYLFANLYSYSTIIQLEQEFISKQNDSLPDNAKIGTIGGSYHQFYLKNHKVYNMVGITSPEFVFTGKNQHWIKAIETIKHHPEHAFEYWLLREKQEINHPLSLFCGEVEAAGADHMSLYQPKLIKSDWSSLQGATQPETKLAPSLVEIGMLDIGYDLHEKKHNYGTYCRIPNKIISYGLSAYGSGTNKTSDVGLLIAGYEFFQLDSINMNKNLHIILRTSDKLTFYVHEDRVSETTLAVSALLKLNVLVDDIALPTQAFNLSSNDFTEISFSIPANYLTREDPEIVVGGDHISYAYWFYQ